MSCEICCKYDATITLCSDDHKCCVLCAENQIKHQMTNVTFYIQCCNGCVLSDDQIKEYIDKHPTVELLNKFNRWKRIILTHQNDNNRVCPNQNCLHVQLADPVISEIICQKCNQKYCFEHELAHNGISCKEYKKMISLSSHFNNMISECIKYLRCKRCPKCRAYIEKNEGCNQMQCTKCRTQFCWYCLKIGKGHTTFDEGHISHIMYFIENQIRDIVIFLAINLKINLNLEPMNKRTKIFVFCMAAGIFLSIFG